MDLVSTASALEDVVGARPPGWELKAIDHLDGHCVDLLAAARAVVVGAPGVDGLPRAAVVAAPDGFATAAGARQLRLDLPERWGVAPGAEVGTVFLVPGLGETLRLNGTLAGDGRGIATAEVYVHCAKAVIRSKLWAGGAGPAEDDRWPSPRPAGDGPVTGDVAALLARSPFVVLVSSAADGGPADASPKGDPAGFVRVLDGRTVAIPDRPGNRRTDTFHNLVEHAAVGVLALVPGEDRVVELRGRARLTTAEEVLAPMAVAGRVPKLALVVDVAHAEVATAPLTAAGLWDSGRHPDVSALPRMSKVWSDHVRLNLDPGPEGDLVRELVTPESVEAGVSEDYRTNLY